MNKAEFLRELEASLSGVSHDDKKDILADYEEHFRFAMAEGQTEEAACAALGAPKAIAKAYKAESLVARASSDRSAGNILRAILAVVSLGFFNLVVVSGIFFGLLGVLIGLWSAGLGLTLGGLAAFLASLAGPFLPDVFAPGTNAVTMTGLAFIGLGLCAFGILWGIGCYYVSKWFYKLIVKYLQFNLRIIKGERA